MKPKRLLPARPPFLTLLTSTYRRPQALAACLASVCRQTAVEDVDQVVFPDHLGLSPADAVYGRMGWYMNAARGEYVHVLGDDDRLATDHVVERLRKFARAFDNPPVLFVKCVKGGVEYPKCGLSGTPREGDVDLCNFVIRQDVWRAFAAEYSKAYKCDWDGYLALQRHAGPVTPCDLVFAVGSVGGGRPETDW